MPLHKLKKKIRSWSHTRKKIAIIGVSAFLVFTGLGALWISSLQMPDLSSFSSIKVSQSTRIYDRTGTVLLYDMHSNQKRTVVPFDQISQFIKNATVSIEDAQFYQHGGIRLTSIFRAILSDVLSGGFSQGGSTITQQVIKNSILTTEKSISRKLKEWILSIELEKQMSKDDILNIYLNENPYGGAVYGVEQASQTFFGTSSASVDLAQAAYIAAIPQAPTYYSPYGQNRAALDTRQKLVLQKMLENNYITQDQYDQAVVEKVTFKTPSPQGILAPHFVEFIRQYLVNKYGEDAVDQNGYKVITTLDYPLQSQAENIIATSSATELKNFNASNEAAVVIDPKTGQILAMVGSNDYFSTSTDGQFNVALAERQPGSTFKPFVYATAFEKGYTPDTVLFDVPTEFQTTCTPQGLPINPNAIISSSSACYMPADFDGLYRGPVSLRNALALSLNIPSIQLLYLAGEKDSLDTAKSMGISSLSDDPNQYGLTLVLGGGEVSLLEMTSAYGVFANDGVRNPYTGILSVQDSTGNTVEQFATNSQQVLPADTAEQLSDVLSDNVAKAPEYGMTGSVFEFPGREVAAKTGTTNDSRDAWTIGYSPDVVVGTWAGNNNNTPMVKNVAGLIVAPIWRQIMSAALASTSNDSFVPPQPIDPNLKPVLRGFWQGNDTYFIDTVSGKLATDQTPNETRQEVSLPDPHSILYWIDKNNPTGPVPTDATSDPQFTSWEYSVQQWLAQNPQVYPVKPTAFDDVHTQTNAPYVSIVSPITTGQYDKNTRMTVNLGITAHYPITKISFYLNSELAGTSDGTAPYTLTFIPSRIHAFTPGLNTLTVDVTDTIYNKGEVSIPVIIQ